jgi:hypothetical protein
MPTYIKPTDGPPNLERVSRQRIKLLNEIKISVFPVEHRRK